MKGLELAEQFFMEKGLPMLKEQFPHLLDHVTAGLVGQGSECLGFDDEISRDHDWGPSFCLWLPKSIYVKEKERLQQAYEQLDSGFLGYPRREVSAQGGGRVGVLETESFYYGFIGSRSIPKIKAEWFYAPETSYACVTNGRLFYHSGSEFEKIREGLKQYYPEDVRLKKIAARAVTMAQAGQYNYVRCMKRNDMVAAFLALSEFVKATCSMLHLLNKRYMPFYKWAFRSMEQLSVLGKTTHNKGQADSEKPTENFSWKRIAENLKLLAEEPQNNKNADIIERICVAVKEELQRQHLTSLNYDFLEPHGMEIMSRIEDDKIRSLPVLFG